LPSCAVFSGVLSINVTSSLRAFRFRADCVRILPRWQAGRGCRPACPRKERPIRGHVSPGFGAYSDPQDAARCGQGQNGDRALAASRRRRSIWALVDARHLHALERCGIADKQVSVSRALIGPEAFEPAGRFDRPSARARRTSSPTAPLQRTRNGRQRPGHGRPSKRNGSCTRGRGVRRVVSAKPPPSVLHRG